MITQGDFKKIWASTSSVPEYTFSDADYQDGWEFVGNLPPTRAMWDTLQRRNDQKMKYLQDNGSMCFDSVADMVATDIDAGQTVLTKGYHSVNDGGSALYTIRAKDVSDVDDGGSIIFLDNDNVAELITDGTVNAKQFGAKGDGVTDDTTAIQNAVDFADVVDLIGGTYKILTVNIYKSFTIQNGHFVGDSFAEITNVFLANHVSNAPVVKFINITFTAPMDKTTAGFEDTVLSSNRFFAFNNEGNATMMFEDCVISNCGYCVKNNGGTVYMKNTKLLNSMMDFFSDNTEVFIDGCEMECISTNSLNHCIYLHPDKISDKNGYIVNSSFYSLSSAPSQLQCYNSVDFGGKKLTNFTVENCTFSLKDSNADGGCLSYEDCEISVYNSKVKASYNTRYYNCDIKNFGVIRDVKLYNCNVTIGADTYFGIDNNYKLLLVGCDIKFGSYSDYIVNIIGSAKLEMVGCKLFVETPCTNSFRVSETGDIKIYNSYIYRDASVTNLLIYLASETATQSVVNNVLDMADNSYTADNRYISH